jgi:general secretion pathway protein D
MGDMRAPRWAITLLALPLLSCGQIGLDRVWPSPQPQQAQPQQAQVPVGVPASAPAQAAQASSSGPARSVALPADRAGADAIAPIVIPARAPSTGLPGATAAAPAEARGADVTLNFRGADIREVAAAILRDILGRNYVVDPGVTGAVTLSMSRPVAPDALLGLFEAVLNSHGATMIQSGDLIRIAALSEDPQARRGAAARGRPAPGQAGQRIEVLPVRHVAAGDLRRVLERVMPAGRVLGADDTRGVVMVQGNAEELRFAEEAVRIFDVDQLSSTSIALIPLQAAQVAELVPELEAVLGGMRRTADPGVLRLIPVERLNAVVILARQPQALAEARAWIQRLDRVRRPNEQRLYVYNLQHGKAAVVAKTLNDAFGSDEAPRPATVPGQAPAAGAGTDTTVDGEGDAATPRMAAASRPATSPLANLRIRADEANNALLVLSTPRDFATLREVLLEVDVPPMQVLIEATVAEVVLGNRLRYGVQYLLNTGGAGITNDGATSLTRGASAAQIQAPAPGFAVTLADNLTPRVILDALSSLTQTRIISTPRLLVLDNRVARLQVGDVVPIVTQSAVSTLTNAPLTVNSVQYRDTGIVLEVTPRVNSSGFVTIEISQSVSDVVRTTTSNIDSPTIRQRRIVSSIGVRSGSTIVLGGLIREDEGRSSSGIPYLHDLPWIGGLFGGRDNTAGRTELIVLLTPRVIRNEQESQDVSQDIRRRFEALVDESPARALRRPP